MNGELTMINEEMNLSGIVETNQVKAGEILSIDDLGTSTAKADFDLLMTGDKMVGGNINMDVRSVGYNNYEFGPIRFYGKFEEDHYTYTLNTSSPDLDLSLIGEFSIMESVVTSDLDIMIEKCDLAALNLMDQDLDFSSKIHWNAVINDLQDFANDILIDSLEIRKTDNSHIIPYAHINMNMNEEILDIKLQSSFVVGYYKGNINFKDFGNLIQNQANQYFEVQDSVPEHSRYFDFNIDFTDTDIFSDFLVKDLHQLKPGQIYGSYNSVENSLDAHFDLRKMIYKKLTIDSLDFRLNGNERSFKTQLRVGQVTYDTLHISNISLNSTSFENERLSSITILDDKLKTKYHD